MILYARKISKLWRSRRKWVKLVREMGYGVCVSDSRIFISSKGTEIVSIHKYNGVYMRDSRKDCKKIAEVIGARLPIRIYRTWTWVPQF